MSRTARSIEKLFNNDAKRRKVQSKDKNGFGLFDFVQI